MGRFMSKNKEQAKLTCGFCYKKAEKLFKTESFGEICAECWAKIFISTGRKSGKAPRKWFGR